MEAIIGSVTDYARDGFRAALSQVGFDVVEEIVSIRGLVTLVANVRADVIVLDGSIVSVADVSADLARFDQVNVLMAVDPADPVDVVGLVKIGVIGLVDATATRRTLGTAALAVAAGHLCVASQFVQTLTASLEWPQNNSRLAPTDLTKRQRDVWNLLLRGMSNDEIATKLGIAPSTARFHVSSIWRRSGLRSRKELMARYVASEMLEG